MTSKKVSDLTAATTLSGSELFYADNGSDVKVSADLIKSFTNAGLTQTSLPEGWISVTDYGAVGDGTTNDTTSIQNAVNAAFGNGSYKTQTTAVGNSVLYFPPGKYKITAPITMNGLFGAKMIGAGRFATQISNTSGTSAFVTNGCSYSRFQDFSITTRNNAVNAAACAFDLDSDGTYTNLQSNTFENIYFDCDAHDIGLRIGYSNVMGSENTIINCFFSGALYGLMTSNFNALQNTIIGGNFQACITYGIFVYGGSVPIISGVGFQNGTATYDIFIQNSANDTYCVSGCRSESDNFIYFNQGAGAVIGCNQLSTTSGVFVNSGGNSFVNVSGCISLAGVVEIRGGGTVTDSQFGRDDWTAPGEGNFRYERLYVGKTLLGSGTGTGKYLEYGYVGWIGSNGTLYPVIMGGATPLTVAGLPAASSFNTGLRLQVTDASTNAFLAAAVGGSTYKVPVICDGTTVWKIG